MSTSRTMPAITLWQPWASLVAAEAKPFEFRSWPAPKRIIGHRVAIHAGVRPVKRDELRELLLKLESPRWRETGLIRDQSARLLDAAFMAPSILWRGAIVCTAVLGQPIHGAALADRLGLEAVNDSDRDEHSNWGWPLTQIERLEPPVPAKGSQGWWTWTPPDA